MDYNHCRVSEGDFKKFSGFLAVGYKVGGFLPPTPNSVTLALFLILSPVMRFVFLTPKCLEEQESQGEWRAKLFSELIVQDVREEKIEGG